MSRKRVPPNQNECTADFRIGVPFEQNLQFPGTYKRVGTCKNIYRVCGTDYPEQVLYLSEGTDAKERKEKLYDCSSGNQRTGKDRTDPAE